MKLVDKMVWMLVFLGSAVHAEGVPERNTTEITIPGQGAVVIKNGKADLSGLKGSSVTTDKNGNSTVNIGKGNQVANESGTVDGKKVPNSKKIAGPKGDSDEAFWGKGGFWGKGDDADNGARPLSSPQRDR